MNDETLWAAFGERSIPADRWTHREHLRVAWIHLRRWSLDEAHIRMRAGIIRLNMAHGLEETPTRGYHETLTRVWLLLIGAARMEDPCDNSEVFLNQWAERLGKEIPLRYYTQERLFSAAARSIFLSPDRERLPESPLLRGSS